MRTSPIRRVTKGRNSVAALFVAAMAAIIIGCGGGGGGGGTTSTGFTSTSTTSTNTTASTSTATTSTSSTASTATTDGSTAGTLLPDRIYYNEQEGDAVNVRSINPNGSSDQAYATFPPGYEVVAVNSANTQRYFAYRSSADANLGLYRNSTLTVDGSTQLVAPTYVYVGSIQVSNDGNTIYYIAAKDGDMQASLYKLTIGAGGPVRLDSAESAHLNLANTQLVYAKAINDVGDTEIFVRGVGTGDNATQLTTNSAFESTPQWNKAGTRIVFARSPDGGPSDIFTMAANGSDEKRVTNTADVDELTPSFSGSGDMVSYVAFSADPSQTGLWRASASGTDQGKVLVKQDAQIYPGTYWTNSSGRSRFGYSALIAKFRRAHDKTK